MSTGSGTIRDWLEHCSNHQSASTPMGSTQQVAKAQSDFEAQVLTALTSNGIQVIGQYPSCGYFIDIVAERDGIRVAIECDGEVWHLDEHGELRLEDLQRQEVLERAGWHVIRIPYRSWRENPDTQVQRVLRTFVSLTEPRRDAVPQPRPVGSVAENYASADTPTPLPTVKVNKFEHAIIQALSDGKSLRDEVFRSARESMGYSRLGNQIRASLQAASQRLQNREIVRVEEDEFFFADDNARKSSYQLGSTPLQFIRQRRRRNYRRFRRP